MNAEAADMPAPTRARETKPRLTEKRLAKLLADEYQRGFDAAQLSARWIEFSCGAGVGALIAGAVVWWF